MISLKMTRTLKGHIFISRALNEDSVLHQLAAKGYTVSGQSLINIELLDFTIDVSYQAVFFYSKTAIQHFFSTETYQGDISYGVMGSASAGLFQSLCGHAPNILGHGNMENLYDKISNTWSGLTVLIPQATQSLQRLEKNVKTINCISKPIYKNLIKQDIELPDAQIILLTSPMNAAAYLSMQSLEGKSLFAIGSSTAQRIATISGLEVPYCKNPSEKSLYNLVLSEVT